MQFLHGFRSGERINGQAAGGQIGRVGDGEVELSLVEEEEGVVAQAVVHLARAPKCHEVYHALGRVYKEIDGSGAQPNVPLHLRNATSSMTRDLGWGKGYSSDLRKVQAIITFRKSSMVPTFLGSD